MSLTHWMAWSASSLLLSAAAVPFAHPEKKVDLEQRVSSLESRMEDQSQRLILLKSESDRISAAVASLEDKIKDLKPSGEDPEAERRFRELTNVVAAHDQRVEQAEKDLQRLSRLGDGLVQGTRKLNAAADVARKNGFENAGPNPQAKSDLIDGIKTFAGAIESSSKAESDPQTEGESR